MPTATVISQYSLTNWGPLTTAFSANAACATPSISYWAPRTALGAGLAEKCVVPTAGAQCYPSGSQLDAVASSAFSSAGYFVMGYFSPGLVCPSGWKTVGAAARASDGSISASGIFIAPTPTSGQTAATVAAAAVFNPPVNAFTAAIDAGETAAACCPSSMTALTDGVCVSTLPNYRPSTICGRIYPSGAITDFVTDITLLGSRTTATLLTYVGSGPFTSTDTAVTLPAAQTSDFVGVSLMPMVMLVHRASDASSAGADGSGGEGGSTGNPAKPNAAGLGRSRAAEGGAQLAWVVCVSAVILGSAFILAV
ncbi:hypothetical protein B0T18DRAFT_331383 [Schizothecium vesticola]|uniref:Uncharacterized protein n=1 Tax=Schizothecium vesticola TaxID=314040 RepID=A0AA40EL91_9PEZI|nr:hypothetical protein B0T18DRAFT_331383 [Schizothecium vesticola]